MKGLKLDFKKIAMQTAGNAAGLVVIGQVNKLAFIKNIQKPVMKGLLTLGLGRIVLPYIGGMMGLGGKKGGDILEGASEAISTYGVIQIAGSFEASKAADQKLFPTISGYEESPYVRGLGLVTEEEVSGYNEEEQVSGNDDVYES
jgi:hypothetical protein